MIREPGLPWLRVDGGLAFGLDSGLRCPSRPQDTRPLPGLGFTGLHLSRTGKHGGATGSPWGGKALSQVAEGQL